MSEETGNSIELSIQRFRPNIIVTGGDEFSEENWDHFQIGDEAWFRHLKLTPRCTVPSRNPTDGSRLYPQNILLVSKVLKGMFPEKTKDLGINSSLIRPHYELPIDMVASSRKNKSRQGKTIRKNKQPVSIDQSSNSHLNRTDSSHSNNVRSASNMIPCFPANKFPPITVLMRITVTLYQVVSRHLILQRILLLIRPKSEPGQLQKN